MLGVRGRGEVSLVVVVALIASQITFGGGMPNAIALQLARRRIVGRDGLRRIAPRWVVPSLVPSLIAGLILFFVENDVLETRVALAVATFLLSFLTIWYSIMLGLLQGERDNRALNVFRVTPAALYLLVLVAVYVIDRRWEPVPVLVTYLGANVIALAVGFRLLGAPNRQTEDELDAKELWSEARRTFISSVGPVDGLLIDQAFVGGVLGQFALGLYATATSLANLSSIVSRSIALVLLPRVSAAAPDEMRDVVRRWIAASVVVDLFVIAVAEIVAGPVIRVAFGTAFVGAIPCARVLIVSDGLLGFRRVLIAVLQGQGRGAVASIVETACMPLLIGGLIAAGLLGGLLAVAYCMALIGAICCVSLAVCVARGTPEPLVTPLPDIAPVV
ncbi:MAG: oligosaccharide flippase family protein [Actinomycetota bacterium]|nr:oligosaccharide flippase family protein [Actinomycetota bacterium]